MYHATASSNTILFLFGYLVPKTKLMFITIYENSPVNQF